MREVSAKVISLIADHMNQDEADIKPEHEFVDDIGIDDLDEIELIMEYEAQFNIIIPDEDWVDKFITVQEVIDYIEEKVKK